MLAKSSISLNKTENKHSSNKKVSKSIFSNVIDTFKTKIMNVVFPSTKKNKDSTEVAKNIHDLIIKRNKNNRLQKVLTKELTSNKKLYKSFESGNNDNIKRKLRLNITNLANQIAIIKDDNPLIDEKINVNNNKVANGDYSHNKIEKSLESQLDRKLKLQQKILNNREVDLASLESSLNTINGNITTVGSPKNKDNVVNIQNENSELYTVGVSEVSDKVKSVLIKLREEIFSLKKSINSIEKQILAIRGNEDRLKNNKGSNSQTIIELQREFNNKKAFLQTIKEDKNLYKTKNKTILELHYIRNQLLTFAANKLLKKHTKEENNYDIKITQLKKELLKQKRLFELANRLAKKDPEKYGKILEHTDKTIIKLTTHLDVLMNNKTKEGRTEKDLIKRRKYVKRLLGHFDKLSEKERTNSLIVISGLEQDLIDIDEELDEKLAA